MLSTCILMSQHQQWGGREGLLSLGGGLRELHEMHDVALCQQPGHTSLHQHCIAGVRPTQQTQPRSLRGPAHLSHRPLHCFWAQTHSCVYLSECGVEDVNHCQKNDSLCFEPASLGLNHWTFIGFPLRSEMGSQLLLIGEVSTLLPNIFFCTS